MSTFAEEQAGRLRQEREAPFKPTHTYHPIGWDAIDPRGVQGNPITHGSPVQLMREHNKSLHSGMPGPAKQMFNVVRDEAGNMQHVNKKSLERANSMNKADMGSGMLVHDLIPNFFHDRRENPVNRTPTR